MSPRRLVRGVLDLFWDSVRRFVQMDGIDRSMGLAAHAFTALFPLLIVVAALLESGRGKSLGQSIVERFELSGSAAASVLGAFPPAGSVEDGVTAISACILVITGLAFTRALQRMYEKAWKLEPRGVRDALYGLAWLTAFCSYIVISVNLHGPVEPELELLFAIAASTVFWLVTPWVITARRIAWPRLLPQALLTAIGMTLLRAGTEYYLPRAIANSARQFGTIGFAFTLVSWFFAAAIVLTVTAAVGAALMDRRPAA